MVLIGGYSNYTVSDRIDMVAPLADGGGGGRVGGGGGSSCVSAVPFPERRSQMVAAELGGRTIYACGGVNPSGWAQKSCFKVSAAETKRSCPGKGEKKPFQPPCSITNMYFSFLIDSRYKANLLFHS